MSTALTKSGDSAPPDAAPTAAEVPNLVTPNLDIPAGTIPKEITDNVATTLPAEISKGGRPAIGFSEEIADEIVDELLAGKTLNEIGKLDKMPSTKTIARWRQRMPKFDERVIAAVKNSIVAFEQHAIDVSRGRGDGEAPTDLAWARLQIETDFAYADRRRQDLSRLTGELTPETNGDGENAKVIDADFEVVITADDPRFAEAIAKFEKKTGVDSGAYKNQASKQP